MTKTHTAISEYRIARCGVKMHGHVVPELPLTIADSATPAIEYIDINSYVQYGRATLLSARIRNGRVPAPRRLHEQW